LRKFRRTSYRTGHRAAIAEDVPIARAYSTGGLALKVRRCMTGIGEQSGAVIN